jgi:hypothetical protein
MISVRADRQADQHSGIVAQSRADKVTGEIDRGSQSLTVRPRARSAVRDQLPQMRTRRQL